MKNVTDWLKDLEDLYEGQKTGAIKPARAVEMNNTIGKVINLTRTELEYKKFRRLDASKASCIPQLEMPAPALPPQPSEAQP